MSWRGWLGNLYPFRLIPAVWVEISGRRHWEFSTLSADFRYLGRDFQPATLGIFYPFGRFSLFV